MVKSVSPSALSISRPHATRFFTFLSRQPIYTRPVSRQQHPDVTGVQYLWNAAHDAHSRSRAPFSTSATHLKKNRKAQPTSNVDDARSTIKSSGNSSAPRGDNTTTSNDPADLSTFETELEKIHTWLKSTLSGLGPGGRANISEILESLRVTIPNAILSSSSHGGAQGNHDQARPSSSPSSSSRKAKRASVSLQHGASTASTPQHPQQGSSNTVPLGDIAQVILRGREVHLHLTVSETGGASSVGGKSAWGKTVDSAIMKSGLGLVSKPATGMSNGGGGSAHTGESDGEGPKIVYAMPIPTAESRKEEVRKAEGWKKDALEQIGHVRQRRQKAIKSDARLKKEEDLTRATLKGMDRIVQDANEGVKKLVSAVQSRVLNS